MGTVVVGVDGSEQARQALLFAAEEARLRSARLRVVAAWHTRTFGGLGVTGGLALDQADMRREAETMLEEAVAGCADRLAGVQVELVVEQGQPADVLVAQARDADLLVVGSRGHGGFTGLLLGSVSQQCAHHAACPVVIVPAPTLT
jgi:nucleotide-binding universal stress UspA family protein